MTCHISRNCHCIFRYYMTCHISRNCDCIFRYYMTCHISRNYHISDNCHISRNCHFSGNCHCFRILYLRNVFGYNFSSLLISLFYDFVRDYYNHILHYSFCYFCSFLKILFCCNNSRQY